MWYSTPPRSEGERSLSEHGPESLEIKVGRETSSLPLYCRHEKQREVQRRQNKLAA